MIHQSILLNFFRKFKICRYIKYLEGQIVKTDKILKDKAKEFKDLETKYKNLDKNSRKKNENSSFSRLKSNEQKQRTIEMQDLNLKIEENPEFNEKEIHLEFNKSLSRVSNTKDIFSNES